MFGLLPKADASVTQQRKREQHRRTSKICSKTPDLIDAGRFEFLRFIGRGKDYSRMAQDLDCKLNAARPRLSPVHKTFPQSTLQCEVWQCIAETVRFRRISVVYSVLQHSVHLLAVQFGIHGAAIRSKFRLDTFEISPNADHDLLAKRNLT
ncbi:hypothetical protein KIN20_003290 [Parelaphostrongylus tenuis]|uniref:Uncharacterized protein n=1 Tax=Parelaphostrongylus tenuis TaxID=148309 RepID=A0AAD5QE83_PARTN|nr:hypothetical protein KIN20_003290 [Parelaphostrongylus tenuis]